MTHGLMIAAPRSGSGKTTVTLGLLRALARRGHKVGSFKCGPDYIDPAFHSMATGHPCLNLDSWTMNAAQLDSHLSYGSRDCDMIVAEASMGLFDGVATSGAGGNGASADIVARYNLPVILIMDVSGQSQSAGAVAMGFSHFDPEINIAGVILGNVASERHKMLAARGVERTGLPVVGALPRGGAPAIPERHLGLVQAGEIPQALQMIDALADAMEQHLDMDALLSLAKPVSMPQGRIFPALPLPGKRIALARDVAFSFLYEHVRMGWEQAGAHILPFSPLADEAPDVSADCCWLPGGYPELHARRLSQNENFLQGLRSFAKEKPVHGECGGYMVLGEILTDAHGTSWPMAGLLPLTTSFAKRKLHLGYRAVRLALDTPIGKAGSILRGHEFHYASIVEQGASESFGSATDANGMDLGSAGQRVGHVTGTFFHAVACERI